MTGLEPSLVARFRDDCLELAGDAPTAAAPLGLAVSGGADSMAMLALAHDAFPGAVIAATVDHRLRAEAADEAAMVARWCGENAVPHTILRPAAPPAGGDLQAKARAIRYDLLARWANGRGVAALATAHHADDQAETLMMRLARGVGIAGMRGIPVIRRLRVAGPGPGIAGPGESGVTVLRPLLGWRRADLRALAVSAGIPFVDDPSNEDDRFERVRVRKLLAREPWLAADRIAQTARSLGEADAELEAMRDWLWRARRVAPVGVDDPDRQLWIDMAGLPRELRRRLARGAIEAVRLAGEIARPGFSAASNVEPLLDALEAGKAATQAGVLVTPKGDVWRFAAAPPRRSH